jgi:hypothetical protein
MKRIVKANWPVNPTISQIVCFSVICHFPVRELFCSQA